MFELPSTSAWWEWCWQYPTVERVVWLSLLALIWACYKLPDRAVVVALDPICRWLTRYLMPCAFVLLPHFWWGDVLAAFYTGRFTLLYLRRRWGSSWEMAIILGLATYPLLSLFTLATVATVERRWIVPQLTYDMSPLVSATPTLHHAVLSTYDMLSFDVLEPVLALHGQQVQAFCYLDSIRDDLFGPDRRTTVNLTARARKIICPRDRLSDQRPARNFSAEYGSALISLTDDLARPLLHWHSHVQPLISYVLESAQRLQYSLLRPSYGNSSLFSNNISALDNVFPIDNICAVDPIIHSFCTSFPHPLCAWFPFRHTLSAVFTTTWTPLISSLRSPYSNTLHTHSLDLFSSLCVFTTSLPLHLPSALTLPLTFYARLNALPWLPEIDYAPAVEELFPAFDSHRQRKTNEPSFFNPDLLSFDHVAILSAQAMLGIDEQTAIVANFRLFEVHNLFFPDGSLGNPDASRIRDPAMFPKHQRGEDLKQPPSPELEQALDMRRLHQRTYAVTDGILTTLFGDMAGNRNSPAVVPVAGTSPAKEQSNGKGKGYTETLHSRWLSQTCHSRDSTTPNRQTVADALIITSGGSRTAQALLPLMHLKNYFEQGSAVPLEEPDRTTNKDSLAQTAKLRDAGLKVKWRDFIRQE